MAESAENAARDESPLHARAARGRPATPRLAAMPPTWSGASGCRNGGAHRLLVFGARRSGSSYLVSLLRADPRVLMHGEMLHVRDLRDAHDGWAGAGALPPEEVFDVRRRNPQPLLDYIACHPEGRRAVGFKVFHDHTRVQNWPVLARWCDVCVLLRREDQLAQYASLLHARQTGRWKGRSTRHGALPVVDPRNASFVDWRAKQERWYAAIARVMEHRLRRRDVAGVVHLTYETHLAGARGPNLTTLTRALGLERRRERRSTA